MKIIEKTYIAFLRGINVGGHHKVPMADLRKEMEALGFSNVVTLLNSGNIVFDANVDNIKRLEKTIATHLETSFGFPIPTIIRTSGMIKNLLNIDPFKDELITKDIRLYVSLLRSAPKTDLQMPWASDDNAYRIIDIIDNTILSVLDVSIAKTPKAMGAFEKMFGKDITTRNWNTIKRVQKKIGERQ